MACGLPLVAARGGALPEVVGDAGVLVPPRDAGALARAITALLGDAPRRAALGQAARTRIMERFRWESAARRLEAVYREVIHAHG
jgi:glycosyltransferase involved in cell wall biosynthesis